MRFAFYLDDYGKPFSLCDLREGKLAVGGQAARFRMLFWLAKRGHEVYLLNHYCDGSVDGVRGVLVRSHEVLPSAVDRIGGVDLFVFNNQQAAPELSFLPIPGARAKAMWAGNPFPASWLDWLGSRHLDRIVCVSHNHREFYRPYPNFHRVEMSYSGVDLDLLDLIPDQERQGGLVVFLGAPRRTKGFQNLLKAWPRVLEARPTARLLVLGTATLHNPGASVGWTGALDAHFEAEFLDPLLGPSRSPSHVSIEFAGLLPLREVFLKLRQASVAVVNCNWEGSFETYCRSAIEAQASGTPVVGAARGSLPEVVHHGETGILVDHPDPRALADAIIRLLNDADLRSRLGHAGHAWARTLGNYEVVCADWEAIARRAINDEPAPAPRRLTGDILRFLGYGRVRIVAHHLVRGTAT